jgi:signal transduction histidine kinase
MITDGKRESTRWASAFVFTSGLGGLSVVLQENTQQVLAYYLSNFFSSISHFFAPYTLLMFSIHYSALFSTLWKNRLRYLLLIPILMMYIIYPIFPKFEPSYKILAIWVVPYILGANTLLLYSYLRENDKVKVQRLMTCILIIPGTLFAMMTNYVLRAFGVDHAWRYNSWLTIIIFVAFMVSIFKYGVLGIRLKYEKLSRDSSMKAITSGTTILTHALKNELSKIAVCAENLEHHINNNQKFHENTKIIQTSVNYLLQLTDKFKDTLHFRNLEEKPNNLIDILERALEISKPSLKSKNITVTINCRFKEKILCDETHIQEVLINIICNAIEAVQEQGEINIEINKNRKWVTLAVKDNGKGIPAENLSHVIEPFFSTKKGNLHFGLGLAYSYNVIQQHGGALEIESIVNEGTTVKIIFPLAKVVRTESSVSREEKEIGAN